MSYQALLSELIEQTTFRFGEPWRLSDKSLTLLVPILRTNAIHERAYRVIEEAKGQVRFTDTGSIHRVSVESKASQPIFVRGGGQLAGAGSQERSVTFGIVVFPEKPTVLSTLCIHASRGIVRGSHFAYSGVVPSDVLSNVVAGSQNDTWSSIRLHSARRSNLYMRRQWVPPAAQAELQAMSDDVVGYTQRLEQLNGFRQKLADLLSKVPGDLDGQVGLVVLNLKGVVGIELFDHEDSWHAFSKNIVRSYSEILMEEEEMGDVFSLDTSRVVDHILDFLTTLKTARESILWQEGDRAATYRLATDTLIGEYTVLRSDTSTTEPNSGRVIHLLATRRSPSPEDPLGGRRYEYLRAFQSSGIVSEGREAMRRPRVPLETTTSGYYRASRPEVQRYFRRKGSRDLVESLHQPQTWTNLETSVNVSTRTLSKLTKLGMRLGLVKKDLRESNGKVTYNLTPLGKAVASDSSVGSAREQPTGSSSTEKAKRDEEKDPRR